VILSGTEEIGPRQLGLTEDMPSPMPGATVEEIPVTVIEEVGDASAPRTISPEEVWDALHGALAEAVEDAIEGGNAALPPLNHWLTDDLVLCAHMAADEVLTRGADLLGIPEATFRRKLRKAMDRRNTGLGSRSGRWDAVSRLLPDVVRMEHPNDDDRLKRARNTLLVNVIRLVPNRRAMGAALMGVTEPTFRRWVRDLESSSVRAEESEMAAAGSAG
jgi:DNA-binding protein Fis